MWDKINSPIIRTAFNVTAPDGQAASAAINQGVIPSSRMAASVQPTNNDVLSIGGKTFICVTALGAATANVQYLRGASAAAAYANLVDAINGKTSTQGTAWVEATTAFALAIVADMVSGTVLRIRGATQRGGIAKASVFATCALTAAITGGASAWFTADLSSTGKSPGDCNRAVGHFALTASQITALASGIPFELPFTPTSVQWAVYDSTGRQKQGTIISDTVTVSGNAVILTLAGATHVVAGDIFAFEAYA